MRDDGNHKPRLVADAAEKLRALILKLPPGAHLGSLHQVADILSVGIVTVQQAARILEHEGLLTVKRGPGGGYYGDRPDDAALERAFATYMRVRNIGYREAFEMTVLLDCDIVQAAAATRHERHVAQIARLLAQLEACTAAEDTIRFEEDFRATLLQIVDRPLLELLATVAMQLYKVSSSPADFAAAIGIDDWKQGRHRILRAILEQDEELAGFEAQRFRRMILDWMHSELNPAATRDR